MTKTILASLLFASGCFAAQIDSTLTVPNADIGGLPGADAGWGFTLTADSGQIWISAITSSLIDETNPALGFYTDLIGPQGGPVNAVLAPSASAWIQNFNDTLGLGLRMFTVDANAPFGAVDNGIIDVLIEAFSSDPNICASCAIGFTDLTIPVSMTVTQNSAIPEPSSTVLLATALLLLCTNAASRRSVHRSSPE